MYQPQIMRLLISLGITMLFCLHAINVIELPFLIKLENYAYDSRLKVTMPATQDPRIVIVALDEKSLAKVGRWPWGRHQLAQLTNNLFEHYRILVLGFDVVFAEQDESSGLPVLDELARGKLGHQADFIKELNNLRPSLERDELFAKTLQNRPILLGYYFKNSVDAKFSTSGTLPDPVVTLDELGRNNIPFIKAAGFGANLPLFQNAAQNGGFFENPMVDADGVNRRIPLLQEYQGKIYQSLSLGLLRTILGDPPITLGITPVAHSSKEVETGLEWIGLGPHRIPVDEKGAIFIPFRGRQGSFPYISASDILDKTATPELLTDAIVLVGSTAPGMIDLHATPIQHVFPGVEIHANILSGILDGVVKRNSPHMLTIELFYFVLIFLAMSLLMPRLSLLWGFYLSLFLILLIGGSNAIFWRRTDMVIPLATPIALTLLLMMLHSFFELLVESRYKQHLERLFGQHLAPTLLAEISRNRKIADIRVERREMTLMFANIRGFSSIANELTSEETVLILKTYLSKMTDVIHLNRGVIDKYMGDVIMAYWGAPLETPRHARFSLRAAQVMIQSMNDLKDEFRAKGWPQLKISIGMSSGMVNVGDMGSTFRMTYTVLGDTVTQALKLESLTKQYGVPLVVGEATRSAVPEVIFRELDRIYLDHHEVPVSIYEPVGFIDEVSGDTRSEVEAYHKAVALYRGQRWQDAEKRFQLLLQRDPERMIYDIYLSRVQHFLGHPPGKDWNGVFDMREQSAFPLLDPT